MTENTITPKASTGVPLKPAMLGGLVGFLWSVGLKALLTKGSPIGPGTTAGDILGIPLLLCIPVALLLVLVGVFLRKRRPNLFAFATGMLFAMFLPVLMG
jgi:hypothetical protein